jgi:hypothetical protein
MKKMCCIVALALLCAGAVFGQAGAKNALSIDAAPFLRGLVAMSDNPDVGFFGTGLFYERLFGSRFSLGGRFDFFFGGYDNGVTDVDIRYLAASAHGRVYPLAQGLQKWYLDLGIGFNTIDVGSRNDEGGLTFALKTGYKYFFNDAIFVEPSIALVYADNISGAFPSLRGAQDPSPFGWTPGLLIGLSF